MQFDAAGGSSTKELTNKEIFNFNIHIKESCTKTQETGDSAGKIHQLNWIAVP
jgi:hypothetical protein